MEKGEIYSHKKFQFKNGEYGDKLLVLLYVPPIRSKPYLFCKTTSQEKGKSKKIGCQSEQSLFFIKENEDFFIKDTWLQLWDIYPMTPDSILQDCLTNYMKKEGKLIELTIRQLMNCIKTSKDVEEEYVEMILKN